MSIIIYPRVSEKSYASAASGNIYTFNVPGTANKIQIKQTVQDLYNVEVTAVNIVNTQGKIMRTVRKGGRQVKGQRAGYKKAFVSVKKGQTIPIFAAETEEKEAKK